MHRNDAPGVYLQAARLSQVRQAGQRGFRQPVPMNVPVGPHVAQELRAIRGRHALPQVRRDVAYESDRLAPVAATGFSHSREAPDCPQHAPRRRRRRQHHRLAAATERIRAEGRLAQPQQAMPRECMEAAATRARRGGQCDVDHRQPCTDEEQPLARTGGRGHAPGLFDVGRMFDEAFGRCESARRRIADGEYDRVAQQLRLVIERHSQWEVTAAPLHRSHACADDIQPHVDRRSEARCVERLLEVVAVPGARHETLRVGVRLTPLQETQEFERLSRIRGHPPGRNIEQVREIALRERNTAPGPLPALHQDDPCRHRMRAPQQVRCQRRAAEPAAYDDDRVQAWCRHGPSIDQIPWIRGKVGSRRQTRSAGSAAARDRPRSSGAAGARAA